MNAPFTADPREQVAPLRRRIEDAIDSLIGLLDEIDKPDEDREPDDEGLETGSGYEVGRYAGCSWHGDPTDADWEPWLGWTAEEAAADNRLYAPLDDREEDAGDSPELEPTEDDIAV